MALGKSSVLGQTVAADERRRWTRYNVDVKLRARVKSGGASRMVHGRGSDISIGGMAIYLAAEMVVGETVEMEVELPYSSTAIQMVAVVRSRRSYQYGVEFMNPSASVRSAIQRACSSLALVQ
jgi:c-di-GMP-binding flagellar brake protein YcgR